ncbi:anthranilate phosphoribosyltransferase [Dendrothele bispora CBS 962.96]|uniref:Anthranilate phosphoribosyltransferase n=1 Tax=Dendrothele bispora (strain CBS 962.96) TaxID=1314807 RepID=A0A4S8KVP4_DENBC|nr:anthranilate phosphoribosyltransferase [Dendrothele bispora CBS 962.96]
MSAISTGAVPYTPESFRPLLKRLVETPEYFTSSDLVHALNHLFTPNTLQPEQIGSFLTALHIHRVERRPESLAAAAQVLRERSLKAQIDGMEGDFVVDIVGTGGDGHNLFNVSTTAAIVAAGAGARVIKHGSRASTSSSGSADLLQALGCIFVAPPPIPNDIPKIYTNPTLNSPNPTPGATPPDSPTTTTATSSAPTKKPKYTPIPNIPFTFILAPHYHPSLSFLAPFRRALPFRTMFNILGPLINPARPRGMVLGIAEPELGWTFAKSLLEGGVERALVVCGEERMDEVSCAGPTLVWSLGLDLEEVLSDVKDEEWPSTASGGGMVEEGEGGKVIKMRITPAMFGLPSHPLVSVAGGSPVDNAKTFKDMLDPSDVVGSSSWHSSGEKAPAKLEPVLHFTLMNASALLVVAGVAKTFKEGVRLAEESVRTGKAWEAFGKFRDVGVKKANDGEGV